MEGKKDVNSVHDKQEDKGKEPVKGTCYRCGKMGQSGRDSDCPARGKTCRKCGGADHFGSQCKTKTAKPPKPRREEKPEGKKKKKSVRCVGSERDENEYAFTVNSASSPEKIDVTVGGVVAEMLIDLGASTNIIDKNLWSKLKQEKIKCVSRKSDNKLDAYGSKQPLNVLGTFSAIVTVEGKETKAKFVIINGEGAALLGRETAIQLGVLKLGTRICTVTSSEMIITDYKEIFEGVGKLKDYQLSCM